MTGRWGSPPWITHLIVSSADTALQLIENLRQFLAFFQRRLGDRALAEDILQEAFVKSLPKGGRTRRKVGPGLVLPRAPRRRDRSLSPAPAQGIGRWKASRASSKARSKAPPELHDEICGCVARLASTLKPECACDPPDDVEGARVQDFAAEAGITRNNALVRVVRAREALRKQVRTWWDTRGSRLSRGFVRQEESAAAPQHH